MIPENDDYYKENPVANYQVHRQYKGELELIGEIGKLRQEIAHLKYLLDCALIRGKFADGENETCFFDMAFVADVKRALGDSDAG